jgi:hypothetical protein
MQNEKDRKNSMAMFGGEVVRLNEERDEEQTGAKGCQYQLGIATGVVEATCSAPSISRYNTQL